MEDCLKCKQAYPDLIVGFDLVGHEDPGVTLREYLPDLLWFTEQVKQQGWWDPSRPDLFDALGERSLPFLFHAGETLESGGVSLRFHYTIRLHKLRTDDSLCHPYRLSLRIIICTMHCCWGLVVSDMDSHFTSIRY